MTAALVIDIGGTHTRLARATSGSQGVTLDAVTQVATPTDATALAALIGAQGAVAAVAIGVAGPVPVAEDAVIHLTNAALCFRRADVAVAAAGARVVVLNDFQAVASAVPALSPEMLDWHARSGAVTAPVAVIGAGTGLGVGAWLGDAHTLPGEGGHVALAATDAREQMLFAALADTEGFTAAEDFLSGPGFGRAYSVLCRLDGLSVPDVITPADVHRFANAGDARALELRRRFVAALGRVAGDVALTFGARAVLLAGGIVPGWGVAFDAAAFRTTFEAKGRYRRYVERIPSATVRHPQPGLLGLAVRALGGAGA